MAATNSGVSLPSRGRDVDNRISAYGRAKPLADSAMLVATSECSRGAGARLAPQKTVSATIGELPFATNVTGGLN